MCKGLEVVESKELENKTVHYNRNGSLMRKWGEMKLGEGGEKQSTCKTGILYLKGSASH